MANNSQTGSSSHDPLGRSRSEIGLEVALAILICLISFLDNFLVVYVVHKDRRLKSLTNVFVQNLALTDISMATLHMPFWVITLYTGTWIFSERWCEIQAVIQCTLGLASILNMGLIAFNRYIPSRQTSVVQQTFPEQENGATLLRPGMDSFFASCNTAVIRLGQDGLPSSLCCLHF